MFNGKNFFIKCINIFLFILVSYILIFIIFYFIPIDLGKVNIQSTKKDNTYQLSIYNIKHSKNFFFLLYEDDSLSNWIYINSKFSSTYKYSFIKQYLPTPHTKYCFFEGSETKNIFNVTLKPKYSLGSTSSKGYIFHLIYIVPYKILFFPSFYFSKDFIFFIDSP